MKKALAIFCSTSIALSLAAFGFCQSAGPGGSQGNLQATAKHKGSPNFRILFAAAKEISPTLNLSKTQQDQLDDLDKKSSDALDDIRKTEKGAENRTERQQKMRDLGESYHKQFFAILNPAQEKQFNAAFKDFVKKWKADHQKKNPAPKGGTTGGGGTGAATVL